MRRRRTPRAVLVAILALGGLLAGCGSSASRTGSAAKASESAGSARTAAGIAAHLGSPLPRGWSTAAGFGGGVLASFGIPSGWTIIEHPLNGSAATLIVPRNSPGTPGPHGLPRSGTIYHGAGAGLVSFTAHPSFGVLGPYETRRSVLGRHLRGYRSTVAAASVPELSDAHVVVESWSGPSTPGGDVMLLGRTPDGAEFEAIAQLQAGHPEFDPVALIESMHLRPQ